MENLGLKRRTSFAISFSRERVLAVIFRILTEQFGTKAKPSVSAPPLLATAGFN